MIENKRSSFLQKIYGFLLCLSIIGKVYGVQSNCTSKRKPIVLSSNERSKRGKTHVSPPLNCFTSRIDTNDQEHAYEKKVKRAWQESQLVCITRQSESGEELIPGFHDAAKSACECFLPPPVVGIVLGYFNWEGLLIQESHWTLDKLNTPRTRIDLVGCSQSHIQITACDTDGTLCKILKLPVNIQDNVQCVVKNLNIVNGSLENRRGDGVLVDQEGERRVVSLQTGEPITLCQYKDLTIGQLYTYNGDWIVASLELMGGKKDSRIFIIDRHKETYNALKSDFSYNLKNVILCGSQKQPHVLVFYRQVLMFGSKLICTIFDIQGNKIGLINNYGKLLSVDEGGKLILCCNTDSLSGQAKSFLNYYEIPSGILIRQIPFGMALDYGSEAGTAPIVGRYDGGKGRCVVVLHPAHTNSLILSSNCEDFHIEQSIADCNKTSFAVIVTDGRQRRLIAWTIQAQ